LYFKIGEVAKITDVKEYVLRYWEGEFNIINPVKSAKGQRVYRRKDIESILLIKKLLYTERYSIEGARKKIKELRKSGELKNARAEALTPNGVEQRAISQVITGLTELIEECKEVRLPGTLVPRKKEDSQKDSLPF
jgi:DNA-binding transcriptional MerR regulator